MASRPFSPLRALLLACVLAVSGPAAELAFLRAALDDVLASGGVDANGVAFSEGASPGDGRFQVEIELATANG